MELIAQLLSWAVLAGAAAIGIAVFLPGLENVLDWALDVEARARR